MNLKKSSHLLGIYLITFCLPLIGKDSITANYTGYVNICKQSIYDDAIFGQFRSIPAYRTALEIDEGDTFAEYVKNKKTKFSRYLENFRLLDQIGNPPLSYYEELGLFTPTTLRYIFHADQILSRFKLPPNAVIAEIGAGFGGQSYILQQIHPCSKYYIYDLPEVQGLIGRVMNALNVQTVICPPLDEGMSEDKIDLVISNYAYSECDREMQLSYFDRIIKKADRGYLIYNQIAITDYGFDSISVNEFVELLKQNGCKPRVSKELFAGAGNFLILWDKTKNKN